MQTELTAGLSTRLGEFIRGLRVVVLLLAITGAVFMLAGLGFIRGYQAPANWSAKEYRQAGFDVMFDDHVRVILGKTPLIVPMDGLHALQQRGGPGQVSELEFHFALPRMGLLETGEPVSPGVDYHARARLWYKHSTMTVAQVQYQLASQSVEVDWISDLRLHLGTGETIDRFVPNSKQVTQIDCGKLYQGSEGAETVTLDVGQSKCTSISYLGNNIQVEFTFDRLHLKDWQALHKSLFAAINAWEA